MMLFAVLCLTVFSILSLVSARAQAALAEKSADSVSSYYKADSIACDIYQDIKNDVISDNVELFFMADGNYYFYEVPIDESQILSVVIKQLYDSYEVLTWKVIYTADWNADENLNVWDGN